MITESGFYRNDKFYHFSEVDKIIYDSLFGNHVKMQDKKIFHYGHATLEKIDRAYQEWLNQNKPKTFLQRLMVWLEG